MCSAVELQLCFWRLVRGRDTRGGGWTCWAGKESWTSGGEWHQDSKTQINQNQNSLLQPMRFVNRRIYMIPSICSEICWFSRYYNYNYNWGEGLQLVEHAAGHGPAPTAPGLVRIENLPLPRRLKVCGWRLVRSTIGNFWAQSECLVGLRLQWFGVIIH